MRKTAIYLRQSADRADSVSLETQEELCRLDTVPGEEIAVYRDRGFSGKNTERPALRSMMHAAENGEIGRILVYKLDRISRNLADFTQLLRVFQAHQIEFVSHTERFETASPMGKAMQSLLMVFAQLERETICGRVRDAAFSRAKIGFDTGGCAPIGYRKIPAQLMGRRTQMLAPNESADIVRDGFSRYLCAEGSLSGICRAWNAQGCKTARGGTWSTNTLCRVLRNPVYAQADSRVYAYLSERGAVPCVPEQLPEGHGVYLYADRRVNQSRFTDLHGVYAICAPHIGLIPPDIWLGCQQKLDASRGKRTRGSGQRTWLSGIIFCASCGSAMTAVRGRSTDYLVCGGKKRGRCGGAGAVWRVSDAEFLVGYALSVRLSELRECGGAVRQDEKQAKLRTELDTLAVRRERLIVALTESDDADIRTITEAVRRLDTHRDALSAQLHAEDAPQRAELPDWESCDADIRKEIAHCLLRCVTAEGGTLHAYFV